MDIYNAIFNGNTEITKNSTGAPKHYSAQDLMSIYGDEQGQLLAFAGSQGIPLWLGLVYLASNLTLNSLNIFWFGKMIQTIRSRFDHPLGTKGLGKEVKHWEREEKVEAVNATSSPAAGHVDIQRVVNADGSNSVEITQRSLRTRRKA